VTDPTEAAVDAVLASAPADGEFWVLTIQALPDPVPAQVRMKVALKRMLRSHGLRCVAVTSGPTAKETRT
jgi:hypothetical protein